MKKTLIYFSLLLNVLFVSAGVLLFFEKGGITYAQNKVDNYINKDIIPRPAVAIRTDSLLLVGNEHKDIVFLGDSHTNYFEWSEYFPNKSIANRGIGSDTTSNIINRLDGVNKVSPNKVFIMAGINDIQQGIPVDQITSNFQKIISSIKEQNPKSEIYIQSVIGVDNQKYGKYYFKDSNDINKKVIDLNEKLKQLSETEKGLSYVDLDNVLMKDNELQTKYTIDGIHLNKEGYKQWVDKIEDKVK